MTRHSILSTAAALALVLGGIGVLRAQQATQPRAQGGDVAEHAQMFRGVDRAVAIVMPSPADGNNDVRGIVIFRDTRDGKVEVAYRIEGLEPGSEHGFHVHEFGDLTSADFTSLGGHYDPQGHEHNLPHQTPRHAGDLGNIRANDQGVAEGRIVVDTITIAGLENPIIGRGIVVHASRDTGEGESGEAGARIAAGVIGVAQPPQQQGD